MCATLAGLTWAGSRAQKTLSDVATYGDGNPVPPHPWNYHQGTVELFLFTAAVALVLAVAGFIGITTARRKSRRA